MTHSEDQTRATKVGRFAGFQVTRGSSGQQYTTIDGEVYLTWCDAANPRLRGLGKEAVVEFEARLAPAVLCNSPAMREDLTSSNLLRVVSKEGAL